MTSRRVARNAVFTVLLSMTPYHASAALIEVSYSGTSADDPLGCISGFPFTCNNANFFRGSFVAEVDPASDANSGSAVNKFTGSSISYSKPYVYEVLNVVDGGVNLTLYSFFSFSSDFSFSQPYSSPSMDPYDFGAGGSYNGQSIYRGQVSFAPYSGAIPEPSTWAMMLLGFGGLSFLGYRKSRKSDAAGMLMA